MMLSVVGTENAVRAATVVEQQKQSGTQMDPQASAVAGCDGEVMELPGEITNGSQEASARSAMIRASNKVAALLMRIRQVSFREAREAGRIEVSRP